jgi:hypothetical protein
MRVFEKAVPDDQLQVPERSQAFHDAFLFRFMSNLEYRISVIQTYDMRAEYFFKPGNKVSLGFVEGLNKIESASFSDVLMGYVMKNI